MYEGLVAISLMFAIPILAILTSFYLKLQRLKIEAKREEQGQDLKLLQKQLDYLLQEQEALRHRIKDLEQGQTPLPPPKMGENYPLPELRLRQERLDPPKD